MRKGSLLQMYFWCDFRRSKRHIMNVEPLQEQIRPCNGQWIFISLQMQKARSRVVCHLLLSYQHSSPTFSPVRAGCFTCFGQRHQHQNIAYFTLGLLCFPRTSNPSTPTLIPIIAHRRCRWKSAESREIQHCFKMSPIMLYFQTLHLP